MIVACPKPNDKATNSTTKKGGEIQDCKIRRAGELDYLQDLSEQSQLLIQTHEALLEGVGAAHHQHIIRVVRRLPTRLPPPLQQLQGLLPEKQTVIIIMLFADCTGARMKTWDQSWGGS